MHRILEQAIVPARQRAFAATAFALGLASAQAQVAQGPLVQAVTSIQAGIWVRTAIPQPTRVKVTAPDGSSTTTASILTSSDSDDTASFVVSGLAPGTPYTYQVGTTDPGSGIERWTGRYTFQTVGATVNSMTIAVVSDFMNKLVPSAALQRAIDSRPGLLAVIGDLDHRDPAAAPGGNFYPPQDAPAVLENMRSMHRDTRDATTAIGANFHAGIVGDPDSGVPQIPLTYAWDDHDFCSNNADRTCPFQAQSFQAYNEYYILAPDNAYTHGCKTPGDFESLTYGGLVQVFKLDARSGRNDANVIGKTAMLGPCQHDWLVDRLRNSKATWKIVLSPVPLNATMKTWDAWSLFSTERTSFLQAVSDVPNVVVISGDVHTGGAIDDGSHSGLPEVSTPHANMPSTWVNTYCRVENGTVLESRPGSWTIGGAVDPVIGVDPMKCLKNKYAEGFPTDGLPAAVYPLDGTNNPGYTWIEATPTSLSVTVRGVDGQVKQGVRADRSAAQLELRLSPK